MTQSLMTALSEIEADLVSAHAHGPQHLHAEVFRKLAALNLDADDRAAVLDMIEREQLLAECKQAGIVGVPSGAAPAGNGFASALALGSLLAGPAMAGIKFLQQRSAYDNGWSNLQASAPELMQQDPARARAIYDLLHSTAPSLSQNPMIAGDLTRQMMAMPMIDVGTVGRLADTGKSIRGLQGDGGGIAEHLGGFDAYPKRLQGMQALLGVPKQASLQVPVARVSCDGVPCVFNWATPAMKRAGLTDAFTGSGTGIEQANNGFGMQQLQQGQTLLPLDAVVRELLAKEMELQQREEMIAQQEQQLQQAQQMMQQMGSVYQQQTGVDPASGQVAPEPPAEEPAADPAAAAPEMGADPAAMGAEDPAAAGPIGLPPEAVSGMQDAAGMPEAAAATEEAAGGEMPPAAEGDVLPAEGDVLPAEGDVPPAEGDVPPAEGDVPPAEGEMAPADGAFPPAEGDVPPAEGDVPPAEGEMPPAMGGDVPTEGDVPPAEGAFPPAEGDVPPAEGEMPPAEGEMPPAEGEMAPGEEAPADEELDGEDVEGSEQELADHHDGVGALPEGSPADQVADEGIADQMNMSGEQPTPAIETAMAPPVQVGMPMPAGVPAQMPTGSPMGAPMGMPMGAQMGNEGFTFTVPMPSLQVHIKMAEATEYPVVAERAAAFAEAERAMANLFRL